MVNWRLLENKEAEVTYHQSTGHRHRNLISRPKIVSSYRHPRMSFTIKPQELGDGESRPGNGMRDAWLGLRNFRIDRSEEVVGSSGGQNLVW